MKNSKTTSTSKKLKSPKGFKKIKGFEELAGFTFIGCAVRTKNIISFSAQECIVDDPLEQQPTGLFMYYPDESPKEQWAFRDLGEATGMHVTAAFKPAERWVCVTDDGEAYVIGGGDDDFEKKITNKPHSYFSNVKSIRNGYAITVGPGRKVFVRNNKDNWTQLSNGLFPEGGKTELDNTGFSDIDGFSETDMYACGGRGDLWKYDGALWKQINIPLPSTSKVILQHICCASDGFVYITTNTKEIIKGRNDKWEIISQDKTKEIFENILEFGGKVLISTVSEIYEVTNKGLQKASLGDMPLLSSKAHIASGDGILVVAGANDAAMFDGANWTVILESDK